MPERIDPYDLPHVILGHVEALHALLGPLRPAMDPGGYLTTHEVDGGTEDMLTDLGFAMAANAASVAESACSHLSRTAGRMTPDTPGYRVLENVHYVAAHTFAMVERALGGIQGATYPVAVAQAAWRALDDLRDWCTSKEVVTAADANGPGEPSATVDAEEEAAPEDAQPGRFRIGDLGDSTDFWKDLGIRKGDIVNVSEGFPSDVEAVEGSSDPGARTPGVTIERALHPMTAYYIGELYEKGMLDPIEEGDDAA